MKKQMSPPFRNKKAQNCIKICYKGNNLKKKKHARVIVIMNDTLSECALQCISLYEVCLIFLTVIML